MTLAGIKIDKTITLGNIGAMIVPVIIAGVYFIKTGQQVELNQSAIYNLDHTQKKVVERIVGLESNQKILDLKLVQNQTHILENQSELNQIDRNIDHLRDHFDKKIESVLAVMRDQY